MTTLVYSVEYVMGSLGQHGLTQEHVKEHQIKYMPRSEGAQHEQLAQPLNVLQRENVLRERGWAFVWDERYWEYQRPGRGMASHHLSGFWRVGEPPWDELVIDLYEVDPATILLPVKEAQ